MQLAGEKIAGQIAALAQAKPEAAVAPRSMSAIGARDWYNAKVAELDGVEQQLRGQGRTAKEIFEETIRLRNEAKLQASDLMKDQGFAESLLPPSTPEAILQKYGGDYEAAIRASKRTNPQVNKAIEEQRLMGDKLNA